MRTWSRGEIVEPFSLIRIIESQTRNSLLNLLHKSFRTVADEYIQNIVHSLQEKNSTN